MGKNEKENCQFFLSAATEKSFSLAASDFRSEKGDIVPVSLFYQYYFTMPFENMEQEVPGRDPSRQRGRRVLP